MSVLSLSLPSSRLLNGARVLGVWERDGEEVCGGGVRRRCAGQTALHKQTLPALNAEQSPLVLMSPLSFPPPPLLSSRMALIQDDVFEASASSLQ